jgi:hypothetical protein
MIRRLFRLLIVLSAVLILAVVGLWIMTNTDFGRERSRRFVLGILQGQTHGIFKIDQLHGNLLSGATLTRVSITDSAGHPFLKADSVSLRYVLSNFLSSKLDFDDVVLYHPEVLVDRLPNGPWNYRILWPATPPPAPGDTSHGWGSTVRLTNVTLINGFVTVRSPWSPREGLSARVRDSLLRATLSTNSRLYVVRAPGGYQKIVTIDRLNGKVPFLRWADPKYKTKYAQVASMSADVFPFRPPAAQVRALVGNFEFNDDSLWWKNASGRLPQTSLKADGVYNLNSGDMRLSLALSPAALADFAWLPIKVPHDGGGTLGMNIVWRGATQDYVMRHADLHTGGAHLTGDLGVTLTDTISYHDANVRFTGLTTKQVEDVIPGIKFPRVGVMAGRAKFSGSLSRMPLDADVTFDAYRRGTSRVIANGVIGFTATKPVVVSARDLKVRMAPLQIDIVKLLFPTLPIAGTLSGTATLNGSGASQLAISNIDVVHQDGRNISHAVGRASVHTVGRQTLDADLDARPLALAEITKFAPTLLLKGLANGPVHAHGPIDALKVDTRLRLPGGGEFGMNGTVDFLSKELAYDVVMDTKRLDLSWIMLFGPVTSLNGGGRARGVGFKPGTMVSDVELAFGPSSIDTIGVDSAFIQAHLAEGYANIQRMTLHGSGTNIAVTGEFGLDSLHSASLTYSVVVDSLYRFARFIPGATTPSLDSVAVRPRPRVAYEAVRRARADSAKVARETEVARAIANLPPPQLRIPTDTPRAIPKGLLAGSLRADGTITGSLDKFSLEGTASGAGIIVQGNSVRHFNANYAWLDARTKKSAIAAQVRADTISAHGFAFDSLTTDLRYAAPNGTLAFRVRQGTERDYAINGDFTVNTSRNELRLHDVALRFDTTSWRSTHASTIRFGASGVEVVNLELSAGAGRRIYANGLLPTKGTANFDLQVTDFAVENVAELLQSDLALTGRLNLDAHVTGNAEDPRLSGKLDFMHGTYNDAPVPELHGTFSYANKQLTTNASAEDSTGRVLAKVDGTIPIDLALSGVTGSRLLDLPINVSLASDSLPIGLIPQFTGAVNNVTGRALGNVSGAGTLKKPALKGDITLSNVGFTLAATGATLERVNGTVRMTGDSVFVDSIAGFSNGPVRLSGTIGVGNWREPTFDLAFVATDAQLLNNASGNVHADADIHVAGGLSAPKVTGAVTVEHGVIYIPESSGKKVIGAGDPSLFAVVDTSLAYQRDLFPVRSAMFKKLNVDVDVNVLRNTWVRSRDANVEVFTDGPLKINVVGDALSLTGAVDADRGEYTFLSKRFQIKRGSALFIGTPDLNPTLQITAEYQVKQAAGTATNIRVLIGGTLVAPRISLESDAQPPLSQSDLLSYLAFGDRSTSLLQFSQTSLAGNSGGNLLNVAGTRLAGIALGVALDEVKGNTARSLGLDVFNITPGDIPLGSGGGLDQFLKGTEVEAGRYVDPRTFVSALVTPGIVSCLSSRGQSNSSCAPPGLLATHRTPNGLRLDVNFSPRYILDTPTLAGQTYTSTLQFGAFLIREWRF